MFTEDEAARRMGFWSAVLLLAALPLSGPIGLVITEAIAPQPPWRDPATYPTSIWSNGVGFRRRNLRAGVVPAAHPQTAPT